MKNSEIVSKVDELELVFPTIEHKAQVEEYLQEFFDNGEYEIAGDGGVDRIKDFDEISYDEANKLMERLKGNKDKLEEFTNEYLRLFTKK